MKKKVKHFVVNFVFKNLPIKKYIVFESYLGSKFTGNPKAIYDYISSNNIMSDYKLIVVSNFNKFEGANTCSVKKNSIKYFYYVSVARFIIVNSRIGSNVTKRDEQIIIQTWHGTPLKRLVHDMVEFKLANQTKEEYLAAFDNEVRQWDLLLSPNNYSTDKFRSAFNYDGDVIECYPRNHDLFKINQDIDVIKERLGINNDKTVYLYTPTFRDDVTKSTSEYILDLYIDLDMLSKFKDKVFLIRAHYLISNELELSNYDNIIDVSDYVDINDLYQISDVLINDFSSTMFDFAITNKPVILFAYDLEHYENGLRGFYLEYNTLSNNICFNNQQLYDVLKENSQRPLIWKTDSLGDINEIIKYMKGKVQDV